MIEGDLVTSLSFWVFAAATIGCLPILTLLLWKLIHRTISKTVFVLAVALDIGAIGVFIALALRAPWISVVLGFVLCTFAGVLASLVIIYEREGRKHD